MKIVSGDEYLESYLKMGLCEDLQSPEYFMDNMSQRHWTLFEYYLTGIRALESWYGDKSYRKYDDWFDVLDQTLLAAENHFLGRFGNE